MSWEQIYNSRKVSAQEALCKIKDNDRVALGHACAEPEYLIQELVRMKDQFHNVELVQMLSLGNVDHCKPGLEEHFRLNTIFVGGNTMEAVAEGNADFTPVHFSEVPKLFCTELPLDAALVMVTPPDENGKVSLGVSVDYTKAAVENARIVIAQVNDQMPFTMGESTFDVEEIDYFVEKSSPLIEVPVPKLSPQVRQIGKNCARLVHDGDTIQLGIGAIPNAVLACLKDKKNVGIHTEMFSDGVMELVKAGVINNSKKVFHRGKMITSFVMGTRELYDFVNRNEDVLFFSIDYINNPWIIAQNDHFVSINSCVEVDLTGQVASESIGFKQISGVGGQVDFVRGAFMAENGTAIIAMQSTANDDTISKIVPVLNKGATVTTNRTDVDYIVTEYGIAHLKGRTLKQRACALIDIAHPAFREELIKEFEKRYSCSYEEFRKSAAMRPSNF